MAPVGGVAGSGPRSHARLKGGCDRRAHRCVPTRAGGLPGATGLRSSKRQRSIPAGSPRDDDQRLPTAVHRRGRDAPVERRKPATVRDREGEQIHIRQLAVRERVVT